MAQQRAVLLRRITAKILSTEPNECWVWKGMKANAHTPTIKWEGRKQRVARILLGLRIGRDLEPNEQARHHCKNPSKLCVNPKHLYVKRLPRSGQLAQSVTRGPVVSAATFPFALRLRRQLCLKAEPSVPKRFISSRRCRTGS